MSWRIWRLTRSISSAGLSVKQGLRLDPEKFAAIIINMLRGSDSERDMGFLSVNPKGKGGGKSESHNRTKWQSLQPVSDCNPRCVWQVSASGAHRQKCVAPSTPLPRRCLTA